MGSGAFASAKPAYNNRSGKRTLLTAPAEKPPACALFREKQNLRVIVCL